MKLTPDILTLGFNDDEQKKKVLSFSNVVFEKSSWRAIYLISLKGVVLKKSFGNSTLDNCQKKTLLNNLNLKHLCSICMLCVFFLNKLLSRQTKIFM